MRTTLTLDDDVATKLDEEVRQSGKSFKAVVNETLRRGLVLKKEIAERPPIRLFIKDMGPPRVPIDNIGAVLDMLDEEEGRWPWKKKGDGPD